MISQSALKEFTKKYQTIEPNIFREYIQHLFLSSLYKIPGSEKLLFKGGTALRIIYGSPRFSEDLDFSGVGIYNPHKIDNIFISTLSEVEKIGPKIDFSEAGKTSGGYLGILSYKIYDFSETMKFEISLRKTKKEKGEVITIVNDYLPSYSLIHFDEEALVKEKIAALLAREKPRDWYDLYFILRHPNLRKYIDKKLLKEVLESLSKSEIDFKTELSVLLPISHHLVLKDFKKNLRKEIEKVESFLLR
jgi:uncharacterized protein